MAILALQSASSGLSALNTQLDVIANNLANVNTVGFKSSRANFQDLIYVERMAPGVENALGDQRPTGLYVGLGVRVSGTQLNFEQGAPLTTNEKKDLMIEGIGFFQVTVEDALGGIGYTRAGNFAINSDGELVLANDVGRRLEPSITIPEDATDIQVTNDGRVLVLQPGEVEPTEVGQIQIAAFVNPQGLKQIGENLYVQTEASGDPIVGNPGDDNLGSIRQGLLESSNVDPTRELVELIRTQRAFEMNSQSIRAADDVLQQVAQLRRG
ncbi:MAG: flagellar basal-body rod protein FlgG [Phycisphaeraceae bacterium]|nr:flagellar basal-body rod protein FlgG [Phycisphaeraceae bacterium]MCW5769542.1 flagellar basal-body rod protein FlgG [Phycisphaeraceae bacterium]